MSLIKSSLKVWHHFTYIGYILVLEKGRHVVDLHIERRRSGNDAPYIFINPLQVMWSADARGGKKKRKRIVSGIAYLVRMICQLDLSTS
jgi:hypothetical protein